MDDLFYANVGAPARMTVSGGRVAVLRTSTPLTLYGAVNFGNGRERAILYIGTFHCTFAAMVKNNGAKNNYLCKI